MIESTLTASGLDTERLLLEITESVALVDVVGTTSVIERLDRLGVAIALDDFGTGYSSLSYLALLRPQIIKIDGPLSARTKASTERHTARGDRLARPKARHDRARRGDRDPRTAPAAPRPRL